MEYQVVLLSNDSHPFLFTAGSREIVRTAHEVDAATIVDGLSELVPLRAQASSLRYETVGDALEALAEYESDK